MPFYEHLTITINIVFEKYSFITLLETTFYCPKRTPSAYLTKNMNIASMINQRGLDFLNKLMVK